MSALVSVIMPAWRPRPDWLRDAVTSVLDERDCELELLVIDDGSEEPVENMLAGIEDPRMRILRVEHCGPYAARDAGIAAARGEFIRFFDADDVAEAASTGRLLELARKGSGTVVYGATLMCDAGLAPLGNVSSGLEGDVTGACVMGGFEVFVVSFLFPRGVVDRAGPWAEAQFPVSGDWDFVLRALEQAPVRRLDEVVTRYRRHGSSVTRKADVAAGTTAGELVLGRYFARHPEQRGSRLERRAYVRLYLDRARAHAWNAQRRRAARELLRAARHDPVAALAASGRWGATRLRGFIARAPRHARRARRTPA